MIENSLIDEIQTPSTSNSLLVNVNDVNSRVIESVETGLKNESQIQIQKIANNASSYYYTNKSLKYNHKHINQHKQFYPLPPPPPAQYIQFTNQPPSSTQPNQFYLTPNQAQLINASNLNLNLNPHYFYTTNSFSNKQNFLDHRNYIKAKKEQNMHKLWPHSVQTFKPNETTNDQKEFNNKIENLTNCNTETVNENEHEKEIKSEDLNANKTPMCLINELVKFNKIKHEYVLLDEIGPAHKKTFFVCLKLGEGTADEETYQSSGTSIKKAQHSAAESALKETKFKKPIPRQLKKSENNNDTNNNKKLNPKNSKQNNSLTATNNKKNSSQSPTVSLNSLCMKLGLKATYEYDQIQPQNNFTNIYTNFNSTEYKPFIYQPPHIYHQHQQQQQQLQQSSQFMFKKNFLTNNNHNRSNVLFQVKLKISDQVFESSGSNLQSAKHNAALKAIDYLNLKDNLNKVKQYAFNIAKVKNNKNIDVNANNENQQQALNTNENIQDSNDTDSKDASIASTNNIKQEKIEPKKDTKITILTRTKSNEISLLSETNMNNQTKPIESKDQNNKDHSENGQSQEEKDQNQQIKSEINILHEYAYQLRKNVSFELVQESGPSHIKKFVTKCSVGSKTEKSQLADSAPGLQYFEVLGEGNSKKSSKRNAAIEMLKILREKFDTSLLVKPVLNDNIQVLSQTNSQEKKTRKNKAKNIIKIKKTSPDYGKGSINPITRLIQIQQAKKEPEPSFELISSTNRFRKSEQTRSRNEFLMSVTIKTESGEILKCEGKGTTKKLAKQNAAEAMLVKLGFPAKLPSQQLKPVLKTPNLNEEEPSSENKNEKRVKFVDDSTNHQNNENKKISIKKPNSKQLSQQKIKIFKDQLEISNSQQQQNNNELCLDQEQKTNFDNEALKNCYKIAHELLESIKTQTNENYEFCSKTAEKLLNDVNLTAKDFENENKLNFKILNHGNEINYKGALDYLANCIKFKCNYQSILGRDGSINSYLTLSILSETEKPFSGQGATYVESSNLAALNALQYLSKLHSN